MSDEEKTSAKRPAEDTNEEEDSDDGWIGPTLSEAAPVKKKKILPYESVYLENLPNAETYERSYMHRDVVTWCLSSGSTGFVVTGSVDGHVKFWKKREVGIEFVKHFRAHLASIKHMTINSTGTLLITISEDKHGKVFDVVNFDMINILSLDFVPECAAWIHQAGNAIQSVAIGIVQLFVNLIFILYARWHFKLFALLRLQFSIDFKIQYSINVAHFARRNLIYMDFELQF